MNLSAPAFLNRNRPGFIVVAVIAVVLVSGAVYWLFYPRPATLVSGVDPQKALAVTQLLDREKIHYSLQDGGETIAVSQSELDQARLKVYAADSSLARDVGLEIFSGNDLGMTDFTQHVNLVRALQGELSRTISGLPGITDARVHIAIPEMSGGARARNLKPQAAVTIKSMAQGTLSPEQVSAIQQLVAAAIPGMTASEVAVIDGHGAPVSSSDNGSTAAPSGRRDQEAYLEGQIRKVLQPILGPQGNLSVAVSVSYSAQQKKTSREELLPSGKWRGMPTGLLEAGKVQYADNAPPASDGKTGSSDPSLDGNTELTFTHGRYVEQTEEAPGKVNRISASVIISSAAHALVASAYEQIIADALGMNPARGDHVTVQVLAEGADPASPELDHATVAAATHASTPARVESPVQESSATRWIGVVLLLVACVVLVFWRIVSRPHRQARLLAQIRAHLGRTP